MAKTGEVVDRDEELRRQAEAQQKILSQIAVGSKFISFKGGQVIIDGKAMPNSKIDVIPIAFLGERAYYPGDFDPEDKQSPKCYAYYEGSSAEAKPHPEAEEPQSASCASCEWNKWGSADKGRGKKCRERLRVAVLPAGPANDVTKEEVWHCRIPITSVPQFKTYANELLMFPGKSLHSAIATVTVVPDAKSFFKINWAPKAAVKEKDLPAVTAKAIAAQRAIAFPYPKFEEEQQAAPKGLKKKARK